MPIRDDLRWFYPIDWPIISRSVRFGRAKGRCERCGRPHCVPVKQLPDGRWLDPAQQTWRDDAGRPAPWPDIVDHCAAGDRRFILGTAHLDHDPANSRLQNLMALCQRCHLRHDREEHRRRRRVTFLLRRATGDLFIGPYRRW